jgi:hypothetical protein
MITKLSPMPKELKESLEKKTEEYLTALIGKPSKTQDFFNQCKTALHEEK